MSSTILPSKPDGVTITQFTSSDSKRGAQWAQAVNMGFNQPQLVGEGDRGAVEDLRVR